eukprot:gene20232-22209_t
MADDSIVELQKAAEELRNSLKGVNDDIKKLTGRDPSENIRPGANRRVQLKRTSFQRGGRIGEPLSKPRRDLDTGVNRRWGRTVGPRTSLDEIERLDSSGEEEDETIKPAIQSVVAAESKPVRLQNKSVEDDKQVKSRNRRMFGLLIGTLQQFKTDTAHKSQTDKKKEEIEKKLEQKAELEKQELSTQKEELFQTRKPKQQALRDVERKVENALLKEEIACHNKPLENFIQLKSQPHIFFLPSKHTDGTLKLLEESRATIKELQNARFRDLDLDEEEFGVSPLKKSSNNGKRFVGRMMDVNDVSHTDLFEDNGGKYDNEKDDKVEETKIEMQEEVDGGKKEIDNGSDENLRGGDVREGEKEDNIEENVRDEEDVNEEKVGQDERLSLVDKPDVDSSIGEVVKEEKVDDEGEEMDEVNMGDCDVSNVDTEKGQDDAGLAADRTNDVVNEEEKDNEIETPSVLNEEEQLTAENSDVIKENFDEMKNVEAPVAEIDSVDEKVDCNAEISVENESQLSEVNSSFAIPGLDLISGN